MARTRGQAGAPSATAVTETELKPAAKGRVLKKKADLDDAVVKDPRGKANGNKRKGGKAAGGTSKPAKVTKASNAKTPKTKVAKAKMAAATAVKQAVEEAAQKPVKLDVSDLAKKKSSKLRPHCAVDSNVPGASLFSVYSSATETFDCMLNQTNISHNNNKFYVIQVLGQASGYYCWTRWGRVGEPGQSKMMGPSYLDDAIKEFKAKFKAKSGNNWDDRDSFVPKSGKYTLIDMADDDDDNGPAAMETAPDVKKEKKRVRPCTLDKTTQAFIKLIFDHDMFKDQMTAFDLGLSILWFSDLKHPRCKEDAAGENI